MYLKDIGFDRHGGTSGIHKPGPQPAPRIWTVAHLTGKRWEFHEVARATHNYDMGSLYSEPDGTWRIIAPTEPGPQYWGAGGEMAVWISHSRGRDWSKLRDVTRHSKRNHNYARRPVAAHPDFYAFWTDGNSDSFSISRLYFTNRAGDKVWRLPYDMHEDYAAPQLVAGTATQK